MKLTINKYIDGPVDYWQCTDETGKVHRLDLVTDSSFPEFQVNIEPYSLERWKELAKSLEGKQIEIELMFPYIPCYFAKNVKIIKP